MLINPQQVRLWLTRFPEGSLVERAECLGCFTMVPFPPPARSTRGFFSNIPCENQVTLLEVNLRKGSPMTGPPRGSSPSSMTVCPGPGSHGGFCSAKLWFPVAACPAVRCEGSSLPCELTPLTDLRRLADFRPAFACCWNGVAAVGSTEAGVRGLISSSCGDNKRVHGCSVTSDNIQPEMWHLRQMHLL